MYRLGQECMHAGFASCFALGLDIDLDVPVKACASSWKSAGLRTDDAALSATARTLACAIAHLFPPREPDVLEQDARKVVGP